MRAVATQPTGLLVKTDEDEALALEYQVTWSSLVNVFDQES